MDAIKFLKTIYLGDRSCKKILIDGWNRRFCMQVDCISKIEEGTKEWNYYNKEDLQDGWLIFSGLESFNITPEGVVPNDLIVKIEAQKVQDGYFFEIYVVSGVSPTDTTEVCVRLHAKALSISSNTEFLIRIENS